MLHSCLEIKPVNIKLIVNHIKGKSNSNQDKRERAHEGFGHVEH